VHGKRSLVYKMPGDDWQRFANLRALYVYMYTRPGKKLLFMGSEFAQTHEWNAERSLDWHLAQYPPHAGIERLLEDIGRIYREKDCLWAWDAEPRGFHWIDCTDNQGNTVSYVRRGPGSLLVAAFNFSPVPKEGYRIGVPEGGYYREILNSDASIYGGSDMGNSGGIMAEVIEGHGQPFSLCLTLPPLAGVLFELARD